jgi:7-alpha-hydroxysteroid dehydrogenase
MILERFRLDDQVALEAGAGRGIGRGIALACAEAGADVVCAARTVEQIEKVAEEIRGLGRRPSEPPAPAPERSGNAAPRRG